MSLALFSGFTSISTVPAGSLAKAASVGAKTVNGPGPWRVSTRPAAFTAATSVVWSFEAAAFSTMFLLAYIGAPPTIGLAGVEAVPEAGAIVWAKAGAVDRTHRAAAAISV